MVAVSKNLILNGVAGGSLGLGIVAILAGLVAFNGDSFYHDDKLGIQLGMLIDATSGEVNVWIHAPRALYIKSAIKNVVKLDPEGNNPEPAGLADLFPIGDTSYGGGEVTFEIFSADEDQMPNLANRTQEIVPMAYIRKTSQFPTAVRYVLLIGSIVLNNWTLFKFAILGKAVLLIVIGFALRYRNKKSDENLVEELTKE